MIVGVCVCVCMSDFVYVCVIVCERDTSTVGRPRSELGCSAQKLLKI